MKTTLTRLFTVMMLIMVSMGAKADVKVLFGEKGEDTFKSDRGTIEVKQETSKEDATKVTVYLIVTPNKGYTMAKDGIELYATIPANVGSTRAPEVSTELTPQCDDFKGDTQKRTYYVNIDSQLALWVKVAQFINGSKNGQTRSGDYSGVYYIGSVDYNAGTPSNNFYLCPTEGWCYYKATDDFTGEDNGMPFLTTFKCKTNDYHSGNPNDAIWTIEKAPAPNSDYYYIKQASTGRYLTSNGTIRTTGNADRMRIHLEAVDPEDLDDKELFTIAKYDDYLTISPKGVVGGAADRNWLTVNGGNKNSLKGESGKTGGPEGYRNTAGIVGVYTQGDANAPFQLEPAAVDKPTITNNYNNTFTITAETGATIYYTTDGTTPTTTDYTGTGTTPVSVSINQTATMTVIKAIAKRAGDTFPSVVTTYEMPQCARPVITVSGGTVTITCATEGATIHYTTNGDPATSTSPNSSSSPVSFSQGGIETIRAVATSPGYRESAEAQILPPTLVHSSSEILNDLGGNYSLADDFTLSSSIGTSDNPFTGTIDGNLVTRTFSYPLVAYADGATIKNVILKDVTISGDINGEDEMENVGAICNEARGATSIYNCGVLPTTILRNDPDDENKITGFSGSSVTGSRYVGSLVGLLGGTSRVINCFSYADVTGGSAAGGIVGYNNGTTTASSIQTMVMNCMFYGDIKGGTSKSPVYGGNNINNLTGGLNTFNYYRYESSYSKNGGITDGNYNCALALEDKYLVRFEFYRQLLNSNKRLAAIYATGSAEDAEEKMAKWVLETADRQNNNPMPFPVLKAQGKYPSIINFDAEHAEQLTLINGRPSEEDRNKGGKIGTLSVTISAPTGWTNKPSDAKLLDENGNETTSSRTITLNRTDKDEARFNFNYDKVQLPYYNDYGTKNYTDNKVVTGWKITSITPTSGEGNAVKGNFKEEDTWGGYNFADRKTYAKDLYSKSDGGSGRVFSQGAYYDVPYGVTAITIEPYWGKAVYVSDANYDVVYNNNNDYTVDDVPELGTQYTNNSDIIINESTQKVYTSISDAVDQLTNSKVVYDNALVLVGNLHLANVPSTNKDKGFTMMSIDLDSDNEPDYSLIYHHDNRRNISPIRFDFLNVPGTAMAQKPNGSARIRNVSIFGPTGWFEVTNTCNISIVQFECDNTSYSSTKIPKASAPVIFQGGMIDQFVSTKTNPSDKLNNTPYIHVGGTAWFNAFGNGTHSDGTGATPHVPVSVTGGDFEGFYLTGTYQPSVNALEDDAECYISGGRFKEAAGASQEQLKGDAHWQIYDADIEHFYGGGINATNNITGNIIVDIFNSHVTQYCGGPKFGDMETDKTVTTEATGCTFGKYFGAGYGGISYLRLKYFDEASTTSFGTWDNQYDNGDRGKYFNGEKTYANSSHADYGKKGPGIATDLDYELFVWSDGRVGGRFYVKFASFSLATCNNVKSTLTNCIVNQDFYGGGSSGKVAGTATSKLDGCIVHGNVFGAGYKSEVEKVNIRNGGFFEEPKYNSSSGMFEAATLSGTTPYEWKNVDSMPDDGETGIEETDGKKYIKTKADFNTLGQVDKTVLTITGNTQVDGRIVNGVNNGGVFGGGDESATIQDTEVTINTTGESSISNVYGGGNIAPVGGNTVVTLKGNTLVSGNVFGGGNEATVSGSATVNIVEQ